MNIQKRYEVYSSLLDELITYAKPTTCSESDRSWLDVLENKLFISFCIIHKLDDTMTDWRRCFIN